MVFELPTLSANAMMADGSVQTGPPWQRLIDFLEVGHFTGIYPLYSYSWLLKFTLGLWNEHSNS